MERAKPISDVTTKGVGFSSKVSNNPRMRDARRREKEKAPGKGKRRAESIILKGALGAFNITVATDGQ